MKYFVLLALVALVSAADEKKPVKEEKKAEERRGLVWPLPDCASEGDLMLHGSICWERVEALHKIKVEEDVDKMMLVHGRNLLRRVSKYMDDNVDFKILPILCRDSRQINNVSRWRIEIPKIVDAPASKRVQRDSPKIDEPRNVTHDNETLFPLAQNSTEKPIEKPASNFTEKPTEAPAKPEDREFEIRRREFYRELGANFARLLMKEWRKETLLVDETEYLARWIGDEAVHFGAMSIYCNQGEDIKEIKKRMAVLLEEK